MRWALHVRPYDGFDLPDGAYPAVERALASIGHRRYVVRRGMVLDLAGWTPPLAPRMEIVPAGIDPYVEVQVDAFDDPPEMVRALCARFLQVASARVLVGVVDGEPVATATGIDLGDTVGIFGVATRKAYRGRGYGTALTVAAIGETRAAQAWLQATDAGHPVYRRMGFRDTGDWVVWTG